MSQQARFVQGCEVVMTTYAHSAAVVTGQVLVVNNTLLIAQENAAANATATYYLWGGFFECAVDDQYDGGTFVYWDDSANKLTTDPDGNLPFGIILPRSSSTADGDLVQALFCPNYLPQVATIAALTAATGTAGTTISDVGGSFSQTTLNNNFKSIATQLNLVIAALKSVGLVASS